MNRNKGLKYMTLEDEPLRSEGIQHATEEKWRTSSSRTKWLGQSPKDVQLQTRLEVKGKFDAAKKNTV